MLDYGKTLKNKNELSAIEKKITKLEYYFTRVEEDMKLIRKEAQVIFYCKKGSKIEKPEPVKITLREITIDRTRLSVRIEKNFIHSQTKNKFSIRKYSKNQPKVIKSEIRTVTEQANNHRNNQQNESNLNLTWPLKSKQEKLKNKFNCALWEVRICKIMSYDDTYYTLKQMETAQSPKKETPFLDEHHEERETHMIATHIPELIPPLEVPHHHNVIIIEEVVEPPMFMYCRYCNMETETYETLYDGVFVWLMCLLLWFFTLFFFWIAFCIPDWKDVEYRCVRCDRVKFIREGSCC